MAGLILLTALAAFIVLLVWFGGFVTRRLSIPTGWKVLLRVVIALGVFPLLVMDEIIGRHQFEAFCRSGVILSIDSDAIRGRTVGVTSNQVALQNSMIPITTTEIIYRDVQSQEVLAKVTGFSARSGWLARVVTQSNDWPPLTFNPVTCWPELSGKLENVYQFSILK